MVPTLFTLGNFNIPTYTVLLDLGLVLGLLLTYFEGKRALNNGSLALDLGLWAVIGGIVGGRIGYAAANWSAFSEDWSRVLRIWEGGLSFHGAFLGGLLVMTVFALLHEEGDDAVTFWELGDVVTPGLALGIAFGWVACLMGGCAYGAIGEGFGYAVLPDIYGVEAPRFATQAVGLGFALILFVGVWLVRRRWPFPGASFLMYCLLAFSGQFFLEFTRGDEAIYLGSWRLAQVLDLVIALAAAAGLMVLWWQARNVPDESEDIAGESSSESHAIEGVDEDIEPEGSGSEAKGEDSEMMEMDQESDRE